MDEVIMGLDVSTTCIGVSIVKYEGDNVTPLHITHLRPKTKTKSKETLFLKYNIFKEELVKYKEYNITRVVIEEPLLSSNNTYTVATLLRFNGMVSQAVYEILNIAPDFISSYDARRYALPNLMAIRKYNKKGNAYNRKTILSSIKNNKLVLFGDYPYDTSKKHVIWTHVSEMFPSIQWVYNKKNELKNENFDASDSLICVIGYINKEKYEGFEPKILNYQEVDEGENITFIYTFDFCGFEISKKITIPKH